MEAVQPVAQSISTYGLYAIIAILCVVAVYLYRQGNEIEKEIHKILKERAEESNKALIETTHVISQNTEAFKLHTQAFKELQDVVLELKTTIQIMKERKP